MERLSYKLGQKDLFWVALHASHLFFQCEANVDGFIGKATEHGQLCYCKNCQGNFPWSSKTNSIAIDESEDVVNKMCHLHEEQNYTGSQRQLYA